MPERPRATPTRQPKRVRTAETNHEKYCNAAEIGPGPRGQSLTEPRPWAVRLTDARVWGVPRTGAHIPP